MKSCISSTSTTCVETSRTFLMKLLIADNEEMLGEAWHCGSLSLSTLLCAFGRKRFEVIPEASLEFSWKPKSTEALLNQLQPDVTVPTRFPSIFHRSGAESHHFTGAGSRDTSTTKWCRTSSVCLCLAAIASSPCLVNSRKIKLASREGGRSRKTSAKRAR